MGSSSKFEEQAGSALSKFPAPTTEEAEIYLKKWNYEYFSYLDGENSISIKKNEI